MKKLVLFIAFFYGSIGWGGNRSFAQQIDRYQVVTRNNPHVMGMDSLSSLSVGNGGFAVTVDGTGLQSFPKAYAKGVPLGTMSDWGWHSFQNPEGFKEEETWKEYDFGRGHKEIYATQIKNDKRKKAAADWFRVNPHRLIRELCDYRSVLIQDR